eukprot:scaffold94591_cov73-Cyclotella_meneghiniana.AAC.1
MMILCTLDVDALSARVPSDVIWTISRGNILHSIPNQQGQGSDFVDHTIQTTAAGLSHSFIIAVSNDIVHFGCGCFVCKGSQ